MLGSSVSENQVVAMARLLEGEQIPVTGEERGQILAKYFTS